MTVDHSDHEVVSGAHRSVQQLVFTATQLVEVIARMRAQTQARQADADRAAAATDTAAADRVRRDRAEQRSAITQDREHWAPVSDPGWRRDTEPEQLLTAWAAATTWAGHDPAAAAAMTRTEAACSVANEADNVSRRRRFREPVSGSAVKPARPVARSPGGHPGGGDDRRSEASTTVLSR